MSARKRYSKLMGARNETLNWARAASELTVRQLLPNTDSMNGTRDERPRANYQSLGTRGASNVAAKLLLSLFSHRFFGFSVTRALAAELGETIDTTRTAFDLYANDIMVDFNESGARSTLSRYLLHLVVAGNALLYFPNYNEMRLFRLDQYVIRRRADGSPLEAVIQEFKDIDDFSDDELADVGLDRDTFKKENPEAPVEIYTRIVWSDGRCEWYSEINDIEVPDTRASDPIDTTRWIAGRWTATDGGNYAAGLAMDHEGDLISYEEGYRALLQYAAAASRILTMRRPGAPASAKEIAKAASGDIINGVEGDVTMVQADARHNFTVIATVLDNVERRLSATFLLQSGVVRDAERVTTEEIQRIAQELEDTLGGVYTVQSHELVAPFVRRMIAIYPDGPDLSGTDISSQIRVGFEALGRYHEANRLRSAVGDAVSLGGDAVVGVLDPRALLLRFGHVHGAEDVSELIIDEEEAARQTQQNAALGAVQSAVPQIAEAALNNGVQSNG